MNILALFKFMHACYYEKCYAMERFFKFYPVLFYYLEERILIYGRFLNYKTFILK